MTANDSSSSATSPLFEVPLAGSGRLSALPEAFLAGRDLDLLRPLTFLAPGELPGRPDAVDRSALAEALIEANLTYGVRHAEKLGGLLAEPDTRVVVTGQQPGVFGGPLLSLSKMIAAIRFARQLTASGSPAVPVFWVATEDHDWDEAARATLPGPSGAAQRFSLGDDQDPLKPLGDRELGPGIQDLVKQLLTTAKGPGAEDRARRLTDFLHPEIGFGEAFCRTMATILGEHAPLFLDSQLPALKQAQQPHLRRLIEERHALDAAYVRVEAEVEERGHDLQVKPQPGVSPLFYVQDGRRRKIEWQGEASYGLRGVDGFSAPVAELLDLLSEEPGRFSPGVLARPAIQDAVLGTGLQVMGPSELTYMTQSRAAYDILGIGPTWTTLRPQLMLVEPRYEGWLREMALPLTELLDRSATEIVAERYGEDFITPIQTRMMDLLDQLEEPILATDKSLEKPLQKTRDHITRGLDNFSSRVKAAIARNNETWTRRVEQMHDALQPLGHLQEREWATAYLWTKLGPEWVDAIFEQMRLESRDLDIIRRSV